MPYEQGYLIPLTELIASVWPTDLVEIPAGLSEALANVGLASIDVTPPTHAAVVVVFREELAVEFPGLSGLELVVGAPERNGEPPPEITELTIGFDAGPPFEVSASLNLELRFPTDVVQALERIGSEPGPYTYEMAEDPRAYVQLTAEFSVNGDGELFFSPIDAPVFHLPPLSIGGSPPPEDGGEGRIGFVLDIPTVALILDEPAELPDGLRAGFRGVFIPEAVAKLPPDMEVAGDPAIAVTNAGLGTGGFSGRIAVRFDELLEANLVGLGFRLREVSAEFAQGALSEGGFAGEIQLPFFDRWIGANVTIAENGDFSVTLSAPSQESDDAAGTPDGLLTLEKEGVLRLQLDHLGLEKQDEDWTVSLGGRVRPLLGGIDWPELEVQRITIFPDGSIHIDGGWVDLPTSQTLNFFGFRLTVSRIGFGNETVDGVDYQWFGADGEIALVEGIPIAGSVRGLKFRWPVTDPGAISVSLEGVGVSLTIPGTLELDGAVSFVTRGPGEGLSGLAMQRFEGTLRLAITPLRMEVSAQVLIAEVQFPEGRETAFMIVLDTTFPTGILLGATGVSIYGLGGLFAMHMAPDRLLSSSTEKSWYEWWKEGDLEQDRHTVATINKWEPERGTFAFGIGAKLGTAMDDGYSLNAGVLLAVIVPGPIVIIDGKLNLLKQRSGSNTQEGAFHVLIVIDGRAGTFLLAIDIFYSIEDILEVEGGAEAFFNFNDSNDWHIYIGQKDPETKRIRAQILSLVEASTYFMVDPVQLAFGARARLGFRGEYGPILVVLEIALGFDVTIVWKPFQLTGEIFVRGELAVKIFGVGIGLLIEAILGGSAPDPYHIFGVFHCKIELFWPIPTIEADIRVEWGPSGAAVPYTPFFKTAAFLHRKSPGNSWELAADGSTVMPADSVLVLGFSRRIGALPVAGGAVAPPPQQDIVDGHVFRYDVRRVTLEVEIGGVFTLYADTLGMAERVFPLLGERSLIGPAGAQEPQLALWNVDPYPGSSEFALPDLLGRLPPCGTGAGPATREIHWNRVPNGVTYPYEFTHMGALFFAELEKGFIAPVVNASCLRTPAVRVRMPEPVQLATFRFQLGFSATVWVAAYRGGVELSRQLVTIGTNPEITFSPPGGFDTVRIEPAIAQQLSVLLQSIFYITERERAESDRLSPPMDPMSEVTRYGQMFLEPGRKYRLRIHTAISVDGREPPPAEETMSEFLFRTLAGPGIEDRPTGPMPAEPSQEYQLLDGILNRVATYVSETLPDAGARVFYPDEDVAIAFDNPYMSDFFETPLSIRVVDSEGTAVAGGLAILLEGAFWGNMFFLSWLAGLERGGCVGAEVPTPHTHELRLALGTPLARRSAYTVELRSDDKTLHSFPAVTSRYAGVAEHLNDVREEGGEVLLIGEAVAIALPTGWFPALTAAVANRSDALASLAAAPGSLGWHDARERVRLARADEAALNAAAYAEVAIAAGLSDAPPDVPFMEATVVSFAGGGRALVVESPEPLPVARLRLELRRGASLVTAHVLANGDCTRLVVVPSSGSLTAGAHTLSWLYASASDHLAATRGYALVDDTVAWSFSVD